MSYVENRTKLRMLSGALAALQLIFPMEHALAAPSVQKRALDPSTLEKYVDSLPIPAVAKPIKDDRSDKEYYEITMSQFTQKLHRDLPPTTVWGYNGTYPGPTIEARRDRSVEVKWINALPDQHLLPVDKTIYPPEFSEVRAVTHLHGGHNESASDGHPNAWFTRNFAQTGPNFVKKVYHYNNDQPATTLWYHDHALGITRLNVYAGLAGFYLLRDKHEEQLELPRGRHEIPIVFQDRSFNADGSLLYPGPTVGGVTPSIVPEFFGDISVVNGKVWPRLKVKPRKYRFRMLDGANSRFYNIQLFEYNEATKTADLSRPGPAFVQIGGDQGFLPKPVRINGRLLMGPGERADVIVDFSKAEGKSFLVHNNAKTPFQSLDQVADQVPLPEIMLIQVDKSDDGSATDQEMGHMPSQLPAIAPADEGDSVLTRDFKMSESVDQFGRPLLLLNDRPFADPTTDHPVLGTREVWRFINTTPDFHPMHIHLVRFRVLDRQPFDVATYLATSQIVFTGTPVPPAANETGFKDTVKSPPGFITRVISRFDLPGNYVVHCHILEHEDHDMMRPFTVVDVPLKLQ